MAGAMALLGTGGRAVAVNVTRAHFEGYAFVIGVMLVALITGVYTFGLVGILLGPMLIGLLKAILDTITSEPAWQWGENTSDDEGINASDA